MDALKNLKKIEDRYVIDCAEHEILINPQLPEKKKYNFRVMLNGEIYYFKGNGFYSCDKSELFCCEIAKHLGLKTINPVPAMFIDWKGNKIEGILSKDYIEDRDNTEVFLGYHILNVYKDHKMGEKFDLEDFYKRQATAELPVILKSWNNLEGYYNAIKILKTKIASFYPYEVTLEENLFENLAKNLMFYFVTSNEDCWSHNIEFLLTKTKKDKILISLAPITDNSISLLLKSFKFDYQNLNKNITDNELQNVVDNVMQQIKIPFSVFSKTILKVNRDSVALEIAKLIKRNTDLKEFYNNLKNLDVAGILNNFKEKLSHVTDTEVKIASMTYKNSIKQLDTALKSLDIFNVFKVDKSF